MRGLQEMRAGIRVMLLCVETELPGDVGERLRAMFSVKQRWTQVKDHCGL